MYVQTTAHTYATVCPWGSQKTTSDSQSLFPYCWYRISLVSSRSIPRQLALVSRWFFLAHHVTTGVLRFKCLTQHLAFLWVFRVLNLGHWACSAHVFPTEHLDSLIFSSWGFKWVTWFFCLKLYLTWPWMFWWFSWLPKTCPNTALFTCLQFCSVCLLRLFHKRGPPASFIYLFLTHFP